MKDRINYLIEKLDITKTKFAERLNISQAFVSQICSGAREPSDRTITDICREFGVNEVWLRTGEGEPFSETTRAEKIMRFAVQTNKGSDEFRKAFVAMLADLSDKGWEGLNEVYTLLSENTKKE